GSGWGYHALLPPDADTTTWVLRLAEELGAPARARLRAARDFVERLTRPDGGVATYRGADAPQLEEFLRMPGPYDGWCGVHTCVTAAAAVLGHDPEQIEFLVRAQRGDGSWTGHWWDDDEYTTARAVEALARRGEHNAAVTRAVEWASARAGGSTSAFATA